MSDNELRQTISASTLINDKVVNLQGEKIGHIKEIMIDLATSRVAYAVLSFGGFMSLGEKLFAIPLQKMLIDFDNKEVRLDIDEEVLKSAPGFDKDNWPDFNMTQLKDIYDYYDVKYYW